MDSRTVLLRNLRWGNRYGLGLATALSVYVLVVSLFTASTKFDEFGLSWWQIIAGYYLAGLLGGTVLGILRPTTKYLLGSLATGILCGVCVYGAVSFIMHGHLDLEGPLVLGSFVGGVGGLMNWLSNRLAKAQAGRPGNPTA